MQGSAAPQLPLCRLRNYLYCVEWDV